MSNFAKDDSRIDIDINATDITPETFRKHIRSLGRYNFPDPTMVDPDGIGIVAVGGDLAPTTLISAYAQGLFPWFNEDEPISWWCPGPRRLRLRTDSLPSKSLRTQAGRERWELPLNHASADVIHACSLPRSNGTHATLPAGAHTWIHSEMIDAYAEPHAQGFGHSIEV